MFTGEIQRGEHSFIFGVTAKELDKHSKNTILQVKMNRHFFQVKVVWRVESSVSRRLTYAVSVLYVLPRTVPKFGFINVGTWLTSFRETE